MKSLLGGLVLLLLFIEIIARSRHSSGYEELASFAVLVGIFAGFSSIVGNATGPVMGIYLIMMGLSNEQLMGTGACRPAAP